MPHTILSKESSFAVRCCLSKIYSPHPPSIIVSVSYNNHHSIQSLLNSLPVNNIPNSPKILRLPILVLQIVRMLPSINPQKWCVFSHDGILVGICADLDMSCFVVLYQPGPARTLDTGEGAVEFCFEGGEVSVGGVDCCLLLQYQLVKVPFLCAELYVWYEVKCRYINANEPSNHQ